MILGDIVLPKEQVTRKCVAILGIRGSGKSNTAKVLVEELIKEGVPVTIVDPDGEYVEEVVAYGGTVVSDFSSDPVELALFHQKSNAIVDVDMSEWREESFTFLAKYLDAMWQVAKAYPMDRQVVIEEAHEFVPQGKQTELSDAIVRIALRGRKRGLGLVFVSQRSAKVNKDALTESELYFLHKVVHPADLKVYKEILPLKPKEIERVVPSLGVGESLLYFNGEVKRVKVRKFELFPQVQAMNESLA
ncbi:MAG: DUF87 domain-containing protein [Candidatus Aramenus sp.]|nr:DUF87 domain-containing protein [Candidatus Aramenus sp.]